MKGGGSHMKRKQRAGLELYDVQLTVPCILFVHSMWMDANPVFKVS